MTGALEMIWLIVVVLGGAEFIRQVHNRYTKEDEDDNQ